MQLSMRQSLSRMLHDITAICCAVPASCHRWRQEIMQGAVWSHLGIPLIHACQHASHML